MYSDLVMYIFSYIYTFPDYYMLYSLYLVLYIYIYAYFLINFLCRLLRNIEYISLCYTVDTTYFYTLFFFLLCPQHMEVPGLGIEPEPQQ